ncbi:MAG: permease [Nitrospiraceae bacterium]|nr:permease [Nitrospiraceae bacterium]
MIDKNSCVAIYKTHEEAEQAIKELERSGFDMKKLSIIGKGYHTEEEPAGYYNTGERVKFWGKEGAFWGGLWGLLFGSAFFWVPGVGPLAVGGPIVSTIVGGLEGAALTSGLSALGAALYSIGIPKDSIIKYETAIKTDQFLVIVPGAKDEVERAREILSVNKNAEVAIHVAA